MLRFHTRPLLLAGSAIAMSVALSAPSQAQSIALDGIVVTTSKTFESAIEALGGASAVGREQLDQQFQQARVSEVLRTIPGVTTQETARDTATAVNIRGLQDFGRVNVLIDGARQNFQRSGHSANGAFYIEPEMIKRVDVTRGPTATVYGSGAIGGVVAFDLLDADDILRAGETSAVRTRAGYATNDHAKLASQSGAVRIGNFDIVGQVNGRWSENYRDGDGTVVPGSNDTTKSAMAKARWRPAAGHQISASLVQFDSRFEDQIEAGGSLRDTKVDNTQYTLGYTFKSPDSPLIDFSAKAYQTTTRLDQTRKAAVRVPRFLTTPPFFQLVTFPAGAARFFSIKTQGVDVHNTSRFTLGPAARLALTYGGDTFKDSVVNVDATEGGDELTPSGQRQVSGAFTQAKLTFFDMINLIGAVRYDSYSLDGSGVSASGERVSPKATAAITPIKGVTVFATYAEGYRAPAITETLVSGQHAPPADFRLLPNPNLRPEVAHNVEAGVNFKMDGVIVRQDGFRAKFVVFQTKVEDYIEQVFRLGPNRNPNISSDDTLQYQNLSSAKLEGIEFEAAYDARAWFLGLGAHRIRGINQETGEGLYTVPADQVTLTAGFRAMGEKLVAGGRVRVVGSQARFEAAPGDTIRRPSDGYALLDLFGQYAFTPDAVLNLNINNVFDKNYRQHLDQFNSPGLNARIGMTVRLGR
jgi:hemoglobin/transferrin/lactoferrin receptor protein